MHEHKRLIDFCRLRDCPASGSPCTVDQSRPSRANQQKIPKKTARLAPKLELGLQRLSTSAGRRGRRLERGREAKASSIAVRHIADAFSAWLRSWFRSESNRRIKVLQTFRLAEIQRGFAGFRQTRRR